MQKNYDNLIQGNSKTINLKFVNRKTGTVIDITDYIIYTTIKVNLSMSDAEATGVNGVKKDITPLNPDSGECSFTLAYEDTIQLEGKYYYDITYKAPTGDRKTMLMGTMMFNKSATQRNT